MFEAHSESDSQVRRHLLQGIVAINEKYFLLLKAESPIVKMDLKQCHCCKLIVACFLSRKVRF